MKWTKRQVKRLMKYYPVLGPLKTSQKMGLTYHQVNSKAKTLGLHHNPPPRPPIMKTGHPDWWEFAKIGFLDIETSQLVADFGFIITWAIRDAETGEVFFDSITEKDVRQGVMDERIVKTLVERMQEYDMLCTYYGTNFDIPFIRTRAEIWGIKFPEYGRILHLDLFYQVRSKFRLHSSRLKSVQDIYDYTDKTEIRPKIWVLAARGDPKALEYIKKHNIADVVVLQKIYNKIEKYFKGTKRSI